MNWNDLSQAASEVGLQSLIITGSLLILFFLGVLVGYLSFRQIRHGNQSHISESKIIGLRARQRTSRRGDTKSSSWWAEFWQGISTEFFGAVVTTIFLGLGLMIFDQYQVIQNRKSDLILQMRSPNNSVAADAIWLLRAEGWLEDGTLRQVELSNAKLQETNLRNANLESVILSNANLESANLVDANLERAYASRVNLHEAILTNANLQSTFLIAGDLSQANLSRALLQQANLRRSNLQGATLRNANLEQANLENANLQMADMWNINLQNSSLKNADLHGANLVEADLTGADLQGADLQMADLWNANLRDANLTDAILSERTRLPDRSLFTEGRDLREFTHPEVWQTENNVSWHQRES